MKREKEDREKHGGKEEQEREKGGRRGLAGPLPVRGWPTVALATGDA